MNGRELWSRKVRINAQANVTTMSLYAYNNGACKYPYCNTTYHTNYA